MKISELKRRLSAAGVRPSKRLGQHFLIDERIIAAEIEAADILKSENILEIGPGLGALTKELAARAKFVFAIERDKRLAEALQKNLAADSIKNFEITVGDAIRLQWPPFDKLVSNIPYQISSPLIAKLGPLGKPAVIILQKEFAERLVAEAGEKNYGRITVLARYYFTPVLLRLVPKASFWPPPEVDGALVRLYPRRTRPKVSSEKFFFSLVRGLFSHPNQNLAKAFVHARAELSLSKLEAQAIAKTLPRPERRVYKMSLEELAEIADGLAGKIKLPR